MINIDIANFTPISAFFGGTLIGIAIILFFVSNGRLAGVSGIVNNTLTTSHNRTVNLLFLFGLILGPVIFMIFINNIKQINLYQIIYMLEIPPTNFFKMVQLNTHLNVSI